MEASMTAKLYPVPETLQENGIISEEQYNAMYKESIENPDKFWGEHKNMIEWYKEPTIIKNTTFDPENVSIKWFEDGQLNVSYNCIDRHLADNAKKTAILWEGDEPTDSQAITYLELHTEVCKLSNVLKKLGIKKGDVVAIYIPMVP